MLRRTSITDSQNSGIVRSIQEFSSETYQNRLCFSHWMASQETETTDIRQPSEEDSLISAQFCGTMSPAFHSFN